jgi:hypothetical protein
MANRPVAATLDQLEREAARNRRRIDAQVLSMRLSSALSADDERTVTSAFDGFDRAVANCVAYAKTGQADPEVVTTVLAIESGRLQARLESALGVLGSQA